MFTDGVPESRNYLKKEYGEARLIDLISINQHLSAAVLHLLILKDIEMFINKEAQFDNITLLVGKIT